MRDGRPNPNEPLTTYVAAAVSGYIVFVSVWLGVAIVTQLIPFAVLAFAGIAFGIMHLAAWDYDRRQAKPKRVRQPKPKAKPVVSGVTPEGRLEWAAMMMSKGLMAEMPRDLLRTTTVEQRIEAFRRYS